MLSTVISTTMTWNFLLWGHQRVGAIHHSLFNVHSHSVCRTERTNLSLTNTLAATVMDSDLVMTSSLLSPLVLHQLAHLSITRPHDFHALQIMYRLSLQLIQALQLSIIYHNHLSLPAPKVPCWFLSSGSHLNHPPPILSQTNCKIYSSPFSILHFLLLLLSNLSCSLPSI